MLRLNHYFAATAATLTELIAPLLVSTGTLSGVGPSAATQRAESVLASRKVGAGSAAACVVGRTDVSLDMHQGGSKNRPAANTPHKNERKLRRFNCSDFGIFRDSLNNGPGASGWSEEADFNCNSSVNFANRTNVTSGFPVSPGPNGTAP